MIFIDRQIVGHEALAVAPADDGITARRYDPLDAETESGVVDVECADDVGLVSHRGGGDVRIMDRGEMNDRFGARHSFHDLTEILDVSNQIVDRAALQPGCAIEDGDFVCGAIQQLANDRLADFAGSAGNKKLHGKYLTSTCKGSCTFVENHHKL